MSDAPPREGMSTTIKVLIGCGVPSVLGVLLVCGGGIVAARWGANAIFEKAETFVKAREAEGYVRQTGQAMQVKTPVTVPTVYKAQVVELRSDTTASVAFAAQVVRIEGTVNGDVDFLGQMLEIAPGAHVTGDIHAEWAQVISVSGTVDGKIDGTYQTLQRMPAPPTPVPTEALPLPDADEPPDEEPPAPTEPAEIPQPAGLAPEATAPTR